MKFTIPFKSDMERAILDGKKSATSRNHCYGKIGDYFELGGRRFHLFSVTRRTLLWVANSKFKEEGFESPRAFAERWAELHPKAGFNDRHRVWLHEFRADEEEVSK
jgi:hypothetical protein